MLSGIETNLLGRHVLSYGDNRKHEIVWLRLEPPSMAGYQAQLYVGLADVETGLVMEQPATGLKIIRERELDPRSMI